MSNDNGNSEDFAEEMKRMKEEMQKMKADMDAMRSDTDEEEINIGKSGKSKSKTFKIEMDDDDFKFNVDDTLNDYLGSVMAGVAENLRSSMSQMAKGFSFDLSGIAHDLDKAKHELKKNEHEVRRAAREAKHQAKRAMRESARVIRFQSLSEEELEKFYNIAPMLAGALSDEKKLKLLKFLEKGPMYQQDLSESTEIKGGTFKHHMDALLEAKFIVQERARGRYLITQLGVEAVKLAEMLFRRFIFTSEEDAQEREIDVEFDGDEPVVVDAELDDEINNDIASDADAVSQNEEEEG
ncbi:MAG: ArsR family transcriptional regulator [Candidatus Kariarchaeaceae archaeon]|jgi:DNA-binding transcriptional ArsR family regulator